MPLRATLMMCLEAAPEHAVDKNLVSERRVCGVGCPLARAKIMVLIAEMCGDMMDPHV
jgi:hypothetical protein